MAQKWYPVIDYLSCKECGACIAKCSHGVYDSAKAPTPVVIHPVECVDHCHGCGGICPAGAITYVGEDTGWTPPHKEQKEEELPCSCASDPETEKRVTVEYLYLDLNTCERCIGTDDVLDKVMMELTPALKMAGFEVEYNKKEMTTADIAARNRFQSSPTIRVNGRDICQTVAENSCGCCSDISGTDVSCRVFEYKGKTYELPPEEMLAEAILSAVFGQKDSNCSCGEYELPDNLKEFYKGKSQKSSCSCGGNC